MFLLVWFVGPAAPPQFSATVGVPGGGGASVSDAVMSVKLVFIGKQSVLLDEMSSCEYPVGPSSIV
jgi:hypothetical protein